MVHRLFLLLLKSRLSHDTSHVVGSVVKYPLTHPSAPPLRLSPADWQSRFFEYHKTSAVCNTLKISLVFFMLLKLCWDKFDLNQTRRIDRFLDRSNPLEPLYITVFSVKSFERISPTMSANTQQSKSCPIPTRVLHLKDWSQLPDCYSQTPGGTLFSTTPGGKTVFYDYTVCLFLLL